MAIKKYLAHYPQNIIQQVEGLVAEDRLAQFLLARYPKPHSIANDKALRDYVLALKNQFLKKSSPVSKVIYDNKLHVLHHALGMHSTVPRLQGAKIKNKIEVRIGSVFKKMPEPFLKMIVVHELAHFKEKQHNAAFYRLCTHMLADYHQLEFDTRLYLVQLELAGTIYS